MGLYERLVGAGDTVIKIPVHDFMAALSEVQRGEMTNAQAAAAFNLDTTEQTEAQAILNKMNQGGSQRLTRVELHDVLLLAESQIPPYDTEANVKTRLGF